MIPLIDTQKYKFGMKHENDPHWVHPKLPFSCLLIRPKTILTYHFPQLVHLLVFLSYVNKRTRTEICSGILPFDDRAPESR